MRRELLKILTTDDIEEIIVTGRLLCENLVRPTSQNILRHLLDENDCPPSIGERFPIVLQAAEDASGRKLSGARIKENTALRAMIVYRLRTEGYSNNDIGKMLHRDHSTVTHLYKTMCDMLSVPKAYREEIAIFQKLERSLGPCQPLQCSQPSSQTTSANALAESPAT